MRTAKGCAVVRVRGREGGAVLKSRETYSSTGGHDKAMLLIRRIADGLKPVSCEWTRFTVNHLDFDRAEFILRLELGVA